MLALPDIKEVTNENSLETLKRVILAVQNLSDAQGSRDTAILGMLVEEQQKTNKHLSALDDKVLNLNNEVSGLSKEVTILRTEVSSLRTDLNTHMQEQTSILKMIAKSLDK
jgi:phage shock protein A